jgi:hypothetical protein
MRQILRQPVRGTRIVSGGTHQAEFVFEAGVTATLGASRSHSIDDECTRNYSGDHRDAEKNGEAIDCTRLTPRYRGHEKRREKGTTEQKPEKNQEWDKTNEPVGGNYNYRRRSRQGSPKGFEERRVYRDIAP